MSRLSFALVLLVGILAGGLGVSLLDRGPAPLRDNDVRGIITDMLAADKAGTPVAELDPAKVNTLIEDYLMSDPEILQRVSDKLAAVKKVTAREAQKKLIQDNHAAIYDDAGNVILGNPNGDVTLVEMFDYNCGYCRGALPDMATLMAEDPNLKIVLKEFPILSDGSVEAAKVAVLVNEDPQLDYWAFHQNLFSARGQVGVDQALKAAEAVGGSRVAMMLNMNAPAVSATLQKSYALADALQISGTPTYIIGDEMIPGAIGLDKLRVKIANMRDCGSTECTDTAG
ncbi:MAG: DsbA family protein [Devosia sp.]